MQTFSPDKSEALKKWVKDIEERKMSSHCFRINWCWCLNLYHNENLKNLKKEKKKRRKKELHGNNDPEWNNIIHDLKIKSIFA